MNEKTTSEIMQAKEAAAIQKYNKLLKEWSGNIELFDESTAIYPDYYGGAYINEDKELVIALKRTSDNGKIELEKIIDLEDVALVEVSHSFNELKQLKEWASDFIKSNPDDSFSKRVVGIGLSNEQNDVYVHILPQEHQENSENSPVNRAFRANKIRMIECKGPSVPATIVYPGSAIENTPNIVEGTLMRSVGFWAMHGTDLGIVTAPHDSMPEGSAVMVGNKTFGRASTPYFGGSVDAVFVRRTDESFTATRVVPYWAFSLDQNSTVALPEGGTIYAVGAASSSMTGTVKDNHYSTTYGLTEVVLVENIGKKARDGDSGGIVAGSGSTALRLIAGIITGIRITGSEGNVDVGDIIYVKAANILSALNVKIYGFSEGD